MTPRSTGNGNPLYVPHEVSKSELCHLVKQILSPILSGSQYNTDYFVVASGNWASFSLAHKICTIWLAKKNELVDLSFFFGEGPAIYIYNKSV